MRQARNNRVAGSFPAIGANYQKLKKMKLEFIKLLEVKHSGGTHEKIMDEFKTSFEEGKRYCEARGWTVSYNKEQGILFIGSSAPFGLQFSAIVKEITPVQTSLFSYSTNDAYRGTIQIVAENLDCANTALVHFLDEEEMGAANPPMSADDWTLNFVVPVGGDIIDIERGIDIPQGDSIVLDWEWTLNSDQ